MAKNDLIVNTCSSELNRTKPDIYVYIPKGGENNDTDNEHFLVFESPSGDELLASWTQSSCENFGNNHIAFARSSDGINWSEPEIIVGSKSCQSDAEPQASWGFPVVSRQGRIYFFYQKEIPGKRDPILARAFTGTIGCLYSDDEGHSWTKGCDIPDQRTPYDHPDESFPRNWIVWQIPVRDSKDRLITGYTLWTSKVISPQRYDNTYWSDDSRSYFMRFDNIDENPAPEEIDISWLPKNKEGLAVPYPNHPDVSVCQEPAIVLLPDGRLFAINRTMTGYIWYAISEDDGDSWTETKVLRYCDGGEKIKQPIASCPIYRLQDGRYLLLFHNNDGHLGKYKPTDALYNRRPAFLSVGHYMPDKDQPIWFSAPKELMDSNGIPIGPKGTVEVATYPSLTEWRGKRVLWYPDRKYFLFGKYITDEWLKGLSMEG